MVLVFKLTQLYFSNQHYFCKEFFLTSFPAWTACRLDNAKTMTKIQVCSDVFGNIFFLLQKQLKRFKDPCTVFINFKCGKEGF